jgi:hypothetical protein
LMHRFREQEITHGIKGGSRFFDNSGSLAPLVRRNWIWPRPVR